MVIVELGEPHFLVSIYNVVCETRPTGRDWQSLQGMCGMEREISGYVVE